MRHSPSACLAFLIALSFTSQVAGFDYLVFAQQYPPGYCRSTFKQKCIETKVRETFTVHGLWPSAENKNLQHCTLEKFKVNELSLIRERLEKAWPSFKTNNPTVFWAHEWNKHGTCGANSPNLTGIFNYFNTTLALHDRYNPLNILKAGGITPSNETPYKIDHVRATLTKAIEGNVQLVCDKADGFKHPLLTEIRFCLGDDLRPHNCEFKKERSGKDLIYLHRLKGSASTDSKPQFSLISYILGGFLIVLYFSTSA